MLFKKVNGQIEFKCKDTVLKKALQTVIHFYGFIIPENRTMSGQELSEVIEREYSYYKDNSKFIFILNNIALYAAYKEEFKQIIKIYDI